MTDNPWPENSDYGKLWRRGYRAGKSDAQAKMLPAMMKLATDKFAPKDTTK